MRRQPPPLDRPERRRFGPRRRVRPTDAVHNDRVADPATLDTVVSLADRVRPVLEARGRIYITGDEILAHLVARIFRRGFRSSVEFLVATLKIPFAGRRTRSRANPGATCSRLCPPT